MPDTPLVLIADDQPDILEALRLLLKAEGYRTVTAHVPEGVIALVEQHRPDAALIDLNYTRDTTSGREGLDLLSRLQALDPVLPVMTMTGRTGSRARSRESRSSPSRPDVVSRVELRSIRAASGRCCSTSAITPSGTWAVTVR